MGLTLRTKPNLNYSNISKCRC